MFLNTDFLNFSSIIMLIFSLCSPIGFALKNYLKTILSCHKKLEKFLYGTGVVVTIVGVASIVELILLLILVLLGSILLIF